MSYKFVQKSKLFSFSDIEDCYYTENSDKVDMHYNELEPFFEDQEEAKHMYDSEQDEARRSQIAQVYDLCKSDFHEENYNELEKQQILKHYEDATEDPEEALTALLQSNSEFGNRIISKDLSASLVNGVQKTNFELDENHFCIAATDCEQEVGNHDLSSVTTPQTDPNSLTYQSAKPETNGNNTKSDDHVAKVPDDEVENEDFDNAINRENDDGMDDRPERVSNLVQSLTPDDFEMIRYALIPPLLPFILT